MNSLTMNPAVGTARMSVNQYPISRLRTIKYHPTINGTSEFATCHKLRHVSGNAYFETIPCHLNFSVAIAPPFESVRHCTLFINSEKGNSDKELRIKFASSITSKDVTGLGTATTKIPARFAAFTPLGESSKTTAASFLTSS